MRFDNHPAFSQTNHRPWPTPSRKWSWQQQWRDLAFIHWEISEIELRRHVPAELEIDCHDGQAWIGIVPFDMKGVKPRRFPNVASLSNFPEINVRTYVVRDGKPGVWFFSLDVPRTLAVFAARKFYHLPYNKAAIDIDVSDEEIRYVSNRPGRCFDATYRRQKTVELEVGSFETWATERYCLYSQSSNGKLYRAEVQHPKWSIERAEIDIRTNELLNGFSIGRQHPSVLFSKQIDVVVWSLDPLKGAAMSPGASIEDDWFLAEGSSIS